MSPMPVDRLTDRDLEGALRLSLQAGWNQTPADWKRLLDLSPEGCFAGRLEGNLVATATVATYGREAGWIGMVLVDEARRGQGLGTQILRHAIDYAASLGLGGFGLDATDLGRPVYLRNGFVDVAPIDRWGGFLRASGPARGTEPIHRDSFAAVAEIDRRACGLDRAELLLRLLGEADATGWFFRDDAGVRGYAILRPGREHTHLGPVVAEDTAVLGALVNAATPFARGTVLVDAPRDEDLGSVLAASGLEVRRKLMRMTHAVPKPLLLGEQIGAATAFEWG